MVSLLETEFGGRHVDKGVGFADVATTRYDAELAVLQRADDMNILDPADGCLDEIAPACSIVAFRSAVSTSGLRSFSSRRLAVSHNQD
jgi:hypothetical protein